jgi:hypothetical protein
MEESFEDYRKMMSKNNTVDTDKDVINYKGNKLNF